MRAINAMPWNRATPVSGQGGGDRCVLPWHCLAVAGAATAATPDVKLGLGGYYSRLKSGDGPLPVAEFVTGEAAGKAAPTNQWYSSVMFQRWSQPLHAHPMTYRATEQGFELGLPSKRHADVGGSIELSYPHVPAIVVSPLGFTPKDARLSKFSDWLAQVSMAAGPDEAFTATVLHGSPFSFYELSKGDVRFRLAARDGVIADPTQAGQDPRVAAVTIAGRSYAIFAPTGSSWEWKQPTELVLRLPENATVLLRGRTAGCERIHAAGFPRRRLRLSDGHPRRMVLRRGHEQGALGLPRADGGQGRREPGDVHGPVSAPLVGRRVRPSVQVRLRLGARPHSPRAGQQLHARAHLQRLRPDVGRPAGPGQQGKRRQPPRRGHGQGAADVQQDGSRHLLDRQGPGRQRAADERGRGRRQDQDARPAPGATQGPPGGVVRRAAFHLLRPGLHARNLRRRTRRSTTASRR